MVLIGRSAPAAADGLDALVRRRGIEIVPFDEDLVRASRAAFIRFGKGRHPAGLNFGDCVSYALAKSRALPELWCSVMPAWRPGAPIQVQPTTEPCADPAGNRDSLEDVGEPPSRAVTTTSLSSPHPLAGSLTLPAVVADGSNVPARAVSYSRKYESTLILLKSTSAMGSYPPSVNQPL